MLTGEARRVRILEFLFERETATVDELARQFDVSRMTIHRDLEQLALARCVRKTHGGATVLPSIVFESNFIYRSRQKREHKRALAKRMAELIEPGMTIILDDSSTTGALVEFLPHRKPLTIITNAASLIAALIRQEDISVICLGGKYHPVTDAFLGVDCELALERLHADLGIFSAAAVHGNSAFLHESELTRSKIAMKAAVDRSFIAFDHGKFGKSALHLFSKLNDFDRVFTTDGASPSEIARLKAENIPIELVVVNDQTETKVPA
jgi:DeoR/GlpR family transcriptional regulator of sugar metabolism